MSTRLIEKQWNYFSDRILPLSAPDIQRIEMKRAFFAGVTATMMIFEQECEIIEQKTTIRNILKEIDEFTKEQILMDLSDMDKK